MKAKCYDKSFVYVLALQTDIRKTFEREYKRLREVEAKAPPQVVTTLRRTPA